MPSALVEIGSRMGYRSASNRRLAMRTRVPVALVAFTLVMVIGWSAPVLFAQAPSGTKKFDPTVVDPQAAIRAAAAAFKLGQPDPNFTPKKTPWGDPDVSEVRVRLAQLERRRR